MPQFLKSMVIKEKSRQLLKTGLIYQHQYKTRAQAQQNILDVYKCFIIVYGLIQHWVIKPWLHS